MKIFRSVRTARITQLFGVSEACSRFLSGGGLIVAHKLPDGSCPPKFVDFYQSIGLRAHNGIDFKTWHGEPLYFPVIDYTVWKAETLPDDSGGGRGVLILSKAPVEIDGSMQYVKFRFWHMKRVVVENGQDVYQGTLLGYCDNTGSSSGDHVHIDMKLCDKDGNTINYDNGYKGAVDFSSWYEDKFVKDAIQIPDRLTVELQLQRFLSLLKEFVKAILA